MPEDTAWDWPLLFYTGTKILGLSVRKFWRTSPRELSVLFKVHIELNPTSDGKGNAKMGYIDQVF